MARNDKLIAKLKAAKTMTWADLVKALTVLGYQPVEGNGSRVKFDNGNPAQLINLHRPHPDNEVKAYALRQVRGKLKDWGYL